MYTTGLVAEPPIVGPRTDALLPQLVTFEIVGEDAGLAEEHVDSLALDDRRAGGVTVEPQEAAVLRLRQLGLDRLVPDDRPLRAVHAQQVALEVLLLLPLLAGSAVAAVTGDEDAVADDDRDAPAPGSAVLHATFSLSLHFSGSPFSVLTPESKLIRPDEVASRISPSVSWNKFQM